MKNLSKFLILICLLMQFNTDAQKYGRNIGVTAPAPAGRPRIIDQIAQKNAYKYWNLNGMPSCITIVPTQLQVIPYTQNSYGTIQSVFNISFNGVIVAQPFYAQSEADDAIKYLQKFNITDICRYTTKLDPANDDDVVAIAKVNQPIYSGDIGGGNEYWANLSSRKDPNNDVFIENGLNKNQLFYFGADAKALNRATDLLTSSKLVGINEAKYFGRRNNLIILFNDINRQTPVCAINYKKSDFKTLHPCGVAVSKLGKVAVCTYEGDQTNGQIFIWNTFADFNADKCADYNYQLNDPEAVVFDNNENLFISDTYDGRVYYTTNINTAPTKFFCIDGDINTGNGHNEWNPRGLSIDAANNLYVMCENLNPVHASNIVVVSNAISANPVRSVLNGSQQAQDNALGVSINGNKLFTTDLKDNSVKMYNLIGNTITLQNRLGNAGLTLDVVSDGTYAYFTNAGGYLVKWNLANNNDTKNINIGSNQTYAPWGVALYGNNLVVADAFHNKVNVYDKNNAPWQ